MASTWAREEGRKEWNEADRTVTKRVFIVGNLISVFLLWLCNLDLFFQGMWRSLSSSPVLAYIQNQEDNPSWGQETAMYSLKWRCMLWWADLDVDWWWVALASSRSIPFRSVRFSQGDIFDKWKDSRVFLRDFMHFWILPRNGRTRAVCNALQVLNFSRFFIFPSTRGSVFAQETLSRPVEEEAFPTTHWNCRIDIKE